MANDLGSGVEAPAPEWTWRFALIGLALFVFAVVALSSPGRIDVVDGHTRYEVGQSLVEHGDSIVRDPDAWFAVFPGRNGQRYTNYRFPQSLLAAGSVVAADLTGHVREARRHFFFSLTGAVLCAGVAILYAGWFRRLGHARLAAMGWAAGGVFCTPTWFYGATTFDDVLGMLVVLASIYFAWILRERRPIGGAVVAGVLMGLAFNCKPPLALFMPAAVAVLWDSRRTADERWLRARIVFFCTAVGAIVYEIYDLWKFPPSTWPGVAEARGEYVPLWPGNPLAGLLSLLLSPGMGAIWYWPAVVLAIYGLVAVCRKRTTGNSAAAPFDGPFADDAMARGPFLTDPVQRRFAWMVALSSAAFLAFIATVRFFSGEPAWGPRYLTPVFGLLWIFVPAGVARLRWPKAAALLAVSLLIQVAGLSIDTMRFFSGENVQAAEGFLKDPWTYFRFDRSQLLARPRQVVEVLTGDGRRAPAFSPAKKPTLPLIIYIKSKQPFEASGYHVLNSLRPWWTAYRYLPPDERPVEIEATFVGLIWTAVVGLTALACAGFWENRLAAAATPAAAHSPMRRPA